MLNIFSRFAPRANATNTNYPYGSIKNESVPGANDGTPLNADWGNDYAGFDAALIDAAGITPSNTPDTALVSQRKQALDKLYKIDVPTIAALRLITPAYLGQQFSVSGHTSAGIGGGMFEAYTGTTTDDNGSLIDSASASFHFKRVSPKKTPYEFGYVDGGNDVSAAINACTTAYGECYLDGGKTYTIRNTINVKVLKTFGGGIATLNAVSPTGDNRFGSQPTTGAVLVASGAAGAPLAGVDVQNIRINCNALINATGSVGTKGFLFIRLRDFYQRACSVYNSASYGFWDTDTSSTGTTYCSGTRDDCYAEDCQISFEQVNVRRVVLNNCFGYLSSANPVYSSPVECIFHAYGGVDMQIEYNNCRGIADGNCPAVFLGLLECKNVAFNDCQFLNNHNGGANIRAAVILDGSGAANFNNVNFDNCILTSTYSHAVRLTNGAGGVEATFKFSRCIIDGFQLAVYTSGVGGRYSFVDCNVKARASGTTTAIVYQIDSTSPIVQVTGGTATATTTGTGGAITTNMPLSIFNGTALIPNTGALPVIRQKIVGTAVFGGDGSTYANLNVTLPTAVLGWTSQAVNTSKVTASLQVDYGVSGAATFPAAVAMAYPTVVALVANDILRFVGNTALNGKTARYEITEYE